MLELDTPLPEIDESTPLQREKALITLWERGLDTLDCVAYHHTTLEALEDLIAKGRIPGHTGPLNEAPHLPQIGDVYFYPRSLNFPFDRLPDLWFSDSREEWYPSSAEKVWHTDELPVSHRFCSLLGLNISAHGLTALNFVEDNENGAKYIDYFEAEAILRSLGFADETLSEATTVARKRKGIIVGLTRAALDKFPLSVGDADYDIRLSPGFQGLPTSAFSGIKPLGGEETAFLLMLKSKHTV